MDQSSRSAQTTEPPKIDKAEVNAAAAPTVVSRWAIHRHMYDWVLSFAHKKHSSTALAALSFAESSFFPIPPDVLLMPLCLSNRKRALWFATVCTLASVVGGVAGYGIGWGLWHLLQDFFFHYIPGFTEKNFNKVGALYEQYDFWIVFIAAFTPIPYKVITIAAGVFHINMPMFLIASAIGRGMRFYLIAILMWKFGAPIVKFIDKYFNLLCVVFTVLLIGGFAILKLAK